MSEQRIPLFRLEELTSEPETERVADAMNHSTHHLLKKGWKKQTMEAVIGAIEMGQTVHFRTAGEWSCHELVSYLLRVTGPADVLLTTYAMSEYEARMLAQLKDTGSIRNLHCVIDRRSESRTPESLQLLKNISSVEMAHCHAKVTVLKNDTWGIAIVGSANWTSNPRIEASVICCDCSIAAFYYDEFIKLFEHGTNE